MRPLCSKLESEHLIDNLKVIPPLVLSDRLARKLKPRRGFLYNIDDHAYSECGFLSDLGSVFISAALLSPAPDTHRK